MNANGTLERGTVERQSFSAWDYVVFICSLVLVTAIGVYYAVQNRRRRSSTKEVLLGNRQMGIIPIALTLVATFVSAVSVLGYSNDIYLFGTMFCWYIVAYIVAYPIATYVYLPVFYGLNLTSAYQYLEIRFSVWVRLMASGLFCCMLIMYMAVVLYAPALALSSVISGLSLTVSILTTGLLATFYTSLGGARAVVVTSTVQMLIVIGGLLAVVIAGIVSNGGLSTVWERAEFGGRIEFADIRVDPRIRHSVWSALVGGTITILTLYSANQMTIQRYISMPTLKRAQFALMLNIPINIVNVTLYMLAGLVLYAEYENRDPKLGGLISKADQTLPYFVMDKLSDAKGLPGLFVAALYSAGLSTMSGGLNAVAAVVLEDFVKPAVKLIKGSELEDGRGPLICQIIAVIFGLSSICLAFGLNKTQGTVIQGLCRINWDFLFFAPFILIFFIALSIFGIAGGPLLGVFTLGMMFPWANRWGAMVGIVCAVCMTAFVAFGALVVGVAPYPLPKFYNQTDYVQMTTDQLALNASLIGRNIPKKSVGGLEILFSVSYQYFGLIAVVTLLIVGLAVSAVTGFNDPKTINPKLLVPFARFLCCCPKSVQNCCSCGVNFDEPEPFEVEESIPLKAMTT